MAFGFRRTRPLAPAAGPRAVIRRRLLEHSTFEIVPMTGVDDAIMHLPPKGPVAITCSPVRGIDATIELAEQVTAHGNRPVPHLSARMVESDGHLAHTIERLEALHIAEVFVVAGDAAEPRGPYADSIALIEQLIERAPFLTRIGVTGYPDGHPFIAQDDLRSALHAKQALLADAGLSGYVATQMCFDGQTITGWLEEQRASGISLPVQLGVPGVVDRSKLLTLGVRLGVGTSLRYLSKNRSAIGRLVSPGGYRPDQLLLQIEARAAELGVNGLHLFTFNQVKNTAAWFTQAMAQVRPTF